jgi:hypothetical protein
MFDDTGGRRISSYLNLWMLIGVAKDVPFFILPSAPSLSGASVEFLRRD